MQIKLTIAFLAVGVFSACAVGLVANWKLMRDFRQEVRDRAFSRFTEDFREYIATHPGWAEGIDNSAFDAFVKERQREMAPPPLPVPSGAPITDRRRRPPFHFLAVSVDGTILKGVGDYKNGDLAPAYVMKDARPVELDGQVSAFVSPVGDIALTPGDKRYLAAMREALYMGLAAASALALLFGLALGRGMSRTLRELTTAIRSMYSSVGERQQVAVRGNDELTRVARAFNEMNDELTRTHAELREMGIRDGLTGLFNRRYFDEQAAQAFEQANRYDQPLTVMIGDLDHFKRVNDDFSHETGDKVLERVAVLMEANTRKSDVVARYGGEEFVILFPQTRGDQAMVSCEKIRAAVESHPWEDIASGLSVTMSMGLCDEINLGSAEGMVSQADRRLYAAKDGGRNRVIHEGD